MSAFYDLSKTPRNILNQAIVRAIVSENNGALFDPSDMTTLYQDAAGTVPVTAVEQPVGKMLDKSGNGYHAKQSITASRPTLSARKNILLATETLAMQSVTTLAATYTLSFTGTGSVTLSGTATGTLTGTGMDNRVSLTVTPTAGTLTLTVSGSVTKAQLELGAVAGQYQRVNTNTDYDTDERYFPKYLRFDGIDDYLSLPYMGLYAAGSASVVTSFATQNLAPFAMLLSERSLTNTNPVWIPARNKGSGLFGSLIRTDTSSTILDSAGLSGILNDGVTKILSIVDAGNSVSVHSNGANAQNTPYTRSGTLTLNNTTIGASISTTNSGFFGGSLYGLIITKSALTDSQRVACERFEARKSGVLM